MHWRRLRPCPSPCNPAYDIGHCEGRSIDKGRIIGLDSSNLSKPPKLCLATGLAMAHSALVSRRFRKRSITSSSSSNIIGHEPFKKYLAFLKKHGAHFDEKYLWD